MKAIVVAAAVLAAVVVNAHAQTATRYAIRGGAGTDCTYTAPCGGIFGAAVALTAGGVIHLLSPGYYANVFNGGTKSLSIIGDGFGSTIDGFGLDGTSQTGSISSLSVIGGSVNYGSSGAGFSVDDVSFSLTGSSGLTFQPTGPSSLTIRNAKFDRASSGSGAAIKINPNGHVVNVSLDNVQVSGGVMGILINAGTGGFVKVSIKNSNFSNINGPGIYATTAAGNVRLYLDNVTSNNNTHGLVVNGAKAIAWMGNSTLAGNSIGVLRSNGGQVLSFKNNYIYNNNTDGTPLTQSSTPPASASVDEQVASVSK